MEATKRVSQDVDLALAIMLVHSKRNHGSTLPCKKLVEKYMARFDLNGRSIRTQSQNIVEIARSVGICLHCDETTAKLKRDPHNVRVLKKTCFDMIQHSLARKEYCERPWVFNLLVGAIAKKLSHRSIVSVKMLRILVACPFHVMKNLPSSIQFSKQDISYADHLLNSFHALLTLKGPYQEKLSVMMIGAIKQLVLSESGVTKFEHKKEVSDSVFEILNREAIYSVPIVSKAILTNLKHFKELIAFYLILIRPCPLDRQVLFAILMWYDCPYLLFLYSKCHQDKFAQIDNS